METSFKFFKVFKIRIFRNIFFSFMISLMSLIFIYAIFTFPMQKNAFIEVMHSEAKTLANSISLVCADAMIIEDDSFIIEHNMAVIKDNPKIDNIIISKSDGMILQSSKDGWKILESLDKSILAFQQKSEKYEIVTLKTGNISKERFHYTMPIVISGIEWGWIHIDFSIEQYNKNIKNMYFFLLYLTLGSLLIVFFVSYFLSKYILNPILTLNQVAKEVSDGNLSAKVLIQRSDEIGDFAKDFNLMIQNLNTSKKALKKSNEKLEERVEQRTKELEELNKGLDKRVKDETEKRRQQEQLLIQQSRQAAMGEMIGNIAHQWRQPLNALGLVLQNIYFSYQMDELDDEFMQNSVEKGKKLTVTMSKTIDDFRDFFKPNKLKENFKVSNVIKNTIELVEASYKNNNVTLDMNLDESLEVNGYPSEFSQVILNVMTNAKDALMEHKENDKTVSISSYEQDGSAIIEITDNAGGIPQGVIEKIFDPYFTTKDEGKGTGIGLYMSKTIIENNMNGRISVVNENEGAKFTIRLALIK